MKAGRELDVRIATEVMGWKLDEHTDDQSLPVLEVRAHDGDAWTPVNEWSPSTSIADAWQVLEKLPMSVHSPRMKLGSGHNNGALWMARAMMDGEYGDQTTEWSFAETAPLAICLAALKAVGA